MEDIAIKVDTLRGTAFLATLTSGAALAAVPPVVLSVLTLAVAAGEAGLTALLTAFLRILWADALSIRACERGSALVAARTTVIRV
jgi:hypothetical protein